jgi:hypothetical protein
MSESSTPSHPASASKAESAPVPGNAPVEFRGDIGDDVSIKRKLLTGLALILALASIYAGMLGLGRAVQIALAAVATAAIFVALKRTRRPPDASA